MRWIAATASVVVVLGLAYWFYTEHLVLRGPVSPGGAVAVHAPDPEDARKLAYETCSANSVERLARIHGTQAHPVFVAAAIGAKSS